MKYYYLASLLFVAAFANVFADELPLGVSNSQNPNDVSLSPAESLSRIQVPDGFQVTLFAGEPDIRRPIAFDIDDRGRLWVIENYSHPNWTAGEGSDRIVILEDSDSDGQFDKRKVFYDRGNYFTAIALGHGGVWVGNVPQLLFIPDRDGDDVPDGAAEVKLDGFQRASPHNVINNLHWGPDGWLYGAQGEPNKSLIGAPGSADDEREMLTRGIWRYHPVDGRFEVLARGMVNPWGADFNEYGDLFTVNTVIAHLWHIVPGMYCQRRGHERDNRFAYDRIQSITDHLHWSGGRWTDSRSTTAQHHVAGGGHAHCGAMIYLGDNWPEEYRGELFTGNLHGNRLNNDKLVPKGSTYVGVHQPDFLFANDPWFRSMTQKYGPDGGVFVSDWHDFGECHDKDGSHRTSGRIYKIVFGKPQSKPLDLAALPDLELAKLHMSGNEWTVRHARRILFERSLASERQATHAINQAADHPATVDQAAVDLLRSQFEGSSINTSSMVIQRLRAMWTLNLISDLPTVELVELVDDSDAHIRKWAAKMIVDRGEWSSDTLDAIEKAANDSQPIVRLVAACAMQKLPSGIAGRRWKVAERLVLHDEDAEDPYLPLMTWYGIESEVNRNVDRALLLATKSRLPRITRYVARKLAQLKLIPLEQLVAFAGSIEDRPTIGAFLTGIAAAIENQKVERSPTSWLTLERRLRKMPHPELHAIANRLALAFGDEAAIAALQDRLVDVNVDAAERHAAFQTLRRLPDGLSIELLHTMLGLDDDAANADALEELCLQSDGTSGALLIARFQGLSRDNQRRAVSALASRSADALLLFANIEKGRINRDLVSAYDLQKLRLHRNQDVQGKLEQIWPQNDDAIQKVETIERYKSVLTDEFLAKGDVARGRQLFEDTCAKCHRLFGEGSTLAPDLTGSGRSDIDYVLSNLVDPSAIIAPAYRLTTVVTAEGRVITGFLFEQTESTVVMRTQQGDVVVPLDKVEALDTSSKSMMPEGQLDQFSDEELRDLILYLASPEQVALP